jgi:hypothetical protein
LERCFEKYKLRYLTSKRVGFNHVYFSPDMHGSKRSVFIFERCLYGRYPRTGNRMRRSHARAQCASSNTPTRCPPG